MGRRIMMKRAWMAVLGLLLAVAARADAPPQSGTPAPEFVLPDASGKQHRLADWRGKWLVLYFYPKDGTPGCTTEAIGFRDRQSQLAELKAQVVGVSLDDGASHLAFAEKHRLTFPLLVDADGKVARRYGALSDFGLFKFARRYTFLIDPDGRVAKPYLSVEASKHVEEVIADLKVFQK
jgi:peroxiredoxin Q/BCP